VKPVFFVLFLVLTSLSESVVFQNDFAGDSDRSTQLSELAGTLRNLVQNVLNIEGVSLDKPFSNQETKLVLNVFLYDFKDGATDVTLSRRGYFSPFDQLKNRGTTNINAFSNFGNLIYMDIGLTDPTLDRPTIAADRVSSKLYGNKFFFYQNFLETFQDLINFQLHNPYSVDATKISTGRVVQDFQWLRESLGSFLGFRGTRAVAELAGRVGVGPGLVLEGSEESIYNTCGAVSDFQDLCDGLPSSSKSAALQAVPFSVIRFLHHHNSLISSTGTFLDTLPGLFFKDLGSSLNIPTDSASFNQEILNDIEAHISREQIARGIGFLAFLYIWEQLESDSPGLGDEFIAGAMASEVEAFTVEGVLQSSKILSGTTCPASPTTPVDKICALDQVLTGVQAKLVSPDSRRFQDYFLDMSAAIFEDIPSTSSSAVNSLEIRNINFPDLDDITSSQDSFLTTGNRPGVNITRRIKDDFQEVVEGAKEEENVDAGAVGDAAGGAAADDGAEAGGDAGQAAGGGGDDAGAEQPAAEETQGRLDFLSQADLNLTTFAIGFVRLENNRTTADIKFRFTDGADALDGVVDGSPLSIASRRISATDSQHQNGTTTYIVTKAQIGEDVRTSVVVFTGSYPVTDRTSTLVKFKAPKASFSRGRVPLLSQPKVPGRLLSAGELFQDWNSLLFKPPAVQRSEQKVFETSGVKDWDLFRPIHEIRKLQAGDPQAFREYTFSFRTLNFLKSADPENLVFENRTAILKEKVVGTGGIRNFTLMLWVDQAFLPPSDSATIITSDPGLSTPPESEVDLEPELEVIPDPRLLLSTAIEASLVLSIPFNGLNYRVDNPLDVPLLVRFFGVDGGLASERFRVVIGSSASSRGHLLKPAPGTETVLTRKAVLKSVQLIDQDIVIPAKASENILILNDGNETSQVILKISKTTGSATVPTVSSTGGGEGCFIVTATFGRKTHRAVKSFSWFRDHFLIHSHIGASMVRRYYRYSPPLARFISDNPFLRILSFFLLFPLWIFVEMLRNTALALVALSIGAFFFHRSKRRNLV